MHLHLAILQEKNRLMNFRKVLRKLCDREMPIIAFCTHEYLFGSPENGCYQATIGQFYALKRKADELNLIVIDKSTQDF